MAEMGVLDTAALLEWPLDALTGGYCAHSQMSEIEAHDPIRAQLFETQGPCFESVSDNALAMAKDAARTTGDISGLSNVDLDVLALALDKQLPLVTDDYRLQNICSHIGHPWRGVIQDGVTEVRKHHLECSGCKMVFPGAISSKKYDHGTCPDCGSNLRLKRQ